MTEAIEAQCNGLLNMVKGCLWCRDDSFFVVVDYFVSQCLYTDTESLREILAFYYVDG